MDFTSIPLLSAIRSKLGYVTQREKLIAQNVANSSTPGYAPRDLKPFQLPSDRGVTMPGAVGPLRTNAAHLSGSAPAPSPFASQAGEDSEVKLDGNAVTLEDEMIKMNDARMQFETAVNLYQKSMDMIRTATRKPS